LIFSDERRLLDGEKVLFVQLNWGKDVREGRFLLKQEVRLFNTGSFYFCLITSNNIFCNTCDVFSLHVCWPKMD